MSLRAIIFDFNGVIADDETPHLLMFQQALREEGLSLTKDEYYGTYLGMDERNCLAALIEQARGRRDPVCEQRVHDRKVALFRDYTAAHKPELFPGVVDFVKQAKGRYRLAIASGGTREQITHALKGTPIEKDFAVIVAAEDTVIGKPDPAIYLLTLKRLNEAAPVPQPPLQAGDCLVIEDSLAGIQSAKAAGMTVLGVATTYSAAALKEADAVCPHPGAISFAQLEQLFLN
ncbi:MAG: HAD family hydrolase [Nitrospiraceae bacterium]